MSVKQNVQNVVKQANELEKRSNRLRSSLLLSSKIFLGRDYSRHRLPRRSRSLILFVLLVFLCSLPKQFLLALFRNT